MCECLCAYGAAHSAPPFAYSAPPAALLGGVEGLHTEGPPTGQEAQWLDHTWALVPWCPRSLQGLREGCLRHRCRGSGPLSHSCCCLCHPLRRRRERSLRAESHDSLLRGGVLRGLCGGTRLANVLIAFKAHQLHVGQVLFALLGDGVDHVVLRQGAAAYLLQHCCELSLVVGTLRGGRCLPRLLAIGRNCYQCRRCHSSRKGPSCLLHQRHLRSRMLRCLLRRASMSHIFLRDLQTHKLHTRLELASQLGHLINDIRLGHCAGAVHLQAVDQLSLHVPLGLHGTRTRRTNAGCRLCLAPARRLVGGWQGSHRLRIDQQRLVRGSMLGGLLRGAHLPGVLLARETHQLHGRLESGIDGSDLVCDVPLGQCSPNQPLQDNCQLRLVVRGPRGGDACRIRRTRQHQWQWHGRPVSGDRGQRGQNRPNAP
mmetsp:Transcript_86348/g.272483  ORF Transcript_86348/g.272483 Transcript_86348/m.272483 type:complete len:427 (-) Transcript_86348:3-1283(-)